MPANALIGIGWYGSVQTVRNANGLLVGPKASDTDFVSTARINIPGSITLDPAGNPIITEPSFSKPTLFVPRFADNGVPEPATWAMMVTGFGLAGAALRPRPRGAVA